MLHWLSEGHAAHRDGLARYGIVAPKAFGVPVGTLLKFAKALGRTMAWPPRSGAAAGTRRACWRPCWTTPAQVTRKQMDAWAAAFDNWGVCDTVCWHLFDYTPFAWEKLRQWSRSPREFVKRAAFAMMAGQAGHNKTATDAASWPCFR